MMGTSLLSVPWAMSQSGLAMGLTISLVMTVIAAFTACAIIKIHAVESELLRLNQLALKKNQETFLFQASEFTFLSLPKCVEPCWANSMNTSDQYFLCLPLLELPSSTGS